MAEETNIPRKHSSRGHAYQIKRRPATTPEPTWEDPPEPPAGGQGRTFVIHKHAARRLHYDLRLEIAGALASWAVPKGLPMRPGQKHLAIQVEDHPLAYADFEGDIPEGNYGAGTVMIWDRGWFVTPHADPAAAIQQGHISLLLVGRKIRGPWSLVRTPTADNPQSWLLIKGKDRPRGADQADAARTEDQRADALPPDPLRHLPSAAPAFLSPMKPHLTQTLPFDGRWIYEIKFDGYRIQAVKDGGEAMLFSRNRRDLSRDFPAIRDAVARLPAGAAVIDGEVVALTGSGLSSFQLLQNRGRAGGPDAPPLFFYAFDLLNLERRDTTGLPLTQRKALLATLMQGQVDCLRLSADIETEPDLLLAKAKEMGLEGIIAKRPDSLYQPGRRSRSWLKIKLQYQQEFVIGGYTQPTGNRSHFGSILIGVYQGKRLRFVGRVGTGFDEKGLQEAHRRFQSLRTADPPFADFPPAGRSPFGGGLTARQIQRCVWLRPALVCQVRFSEWTEDGSIRHPVFLAFREDKLAREVHREPPLHPPT
jgi:bifunctional non-homologous end joining protein LigD